MTMSSSAPSAAALSVSRKAPAVGHRSELQLNRWLAGVDEHEEFATGFLPEGATDALGRPAGLAVGADGALYVSDDKAGFIYRITAPGAGD